ncbi:IS66 family transposase [Vineibacter terrae]|uniref:IS66 family transposase n=1 Tax=Vineibacter terrae TaxID=2586908 RepID=A0A5C8PR79_9HYPH|nr:IS66 family transposase [Vineibacter terrae]
MGPQQRLLLDDGRIEIDSNAVERAIRSAALHRKNALFAGSDGGGEHWAVLGSLIEICKLNAIAPEAYLAWLFGKLALKRRMADSTSCCPGPTPTRCEPPRSTPPRQPSRKASARLVGPQQRLRLAHTMMVDLVAQGPTYDERRHVHGPASHEAGTHLPPRDTEIGNRRADIGFRLRGGHAQPVLTLLDTRQSLLKHLAPRGDAGIIRLDQTTLEIQVPLGRRGAIGHCSRRCRRQHDPLRVAGHGGGDHRAAVAARQDEHLGTVAARLRDIAVQVPGRQVLLALVEGEEDAATIGVRRYKKEAGGSLRTGNSCEGCADLVVGR